MSDHPTSPSVWTPIEIRGWKPGMHRLFRNDDPKLTEAYSARQRLYLCDDSGATPDQTDDGPLRVFADPGFELVSDNPGRPPGIGISVVRESRNCTTALERDCRCVVNIVVAKAIAGYFNYHLQFTLEGVTFRAIG